MLPQLVSSSLIRSSAARFWTIDTEDRSEAGPLGISAEEPCMRDRPIALRDLALGSDPEAIVQVARQTSLTATEAATRVRRGCHCSSLTLGGELASLCWISDEPEWVGELNLWFEPSPGQAYVWSCETRARYRGHHLYPELLRRIVDDLSRRGYRRVWIATEIHNQRSAHGVQRAGFQPAGLVSTFRFAGIRWKQVTADPLISPRVADDLRRGLKWFRGGG